MFQEASRPGSALPLAGRKGVVGRTLLLAGVLMAGLGAAVQAQLPPPARLSKTPPAGDAAGTLPSARSILDRHLEAIGGREALLSHSSLYAKGTLSMPAAGMNGALEIYSAKPNKLFVKISLDGVGEVMEGFDGSHGWSLSPMTGPMLQEGKELADKRLDANFHGELKPDSQYASMTTLERIDFDGRPCYKVRLVRTTGREDTEFYDVATGLKAGGITTRTTHMGEVTSTNYEGNYRKFGNVLHATTMRQQVGPVEQVITLTSIEYDNVNPSIFDLPAGIKALLK
jgi:hypothetical protein